MAVGVFAWVVTPGSSVQRASLMAAVHLGARVLDHRTASWQALATAAAAMIVLDPLGIADVGLLLTCGATMALIECARQTARGPAWSPWRWLVTAVAATACVELVVFPIQVWWFARLSFAGLILNLVALPLMTVAQVAGLLVVALDLAGGPAAPAGWVASHAVTTLDASMRLVEWAPWLARTTPPPAAWLIVVYYIALVAWWASAGWRRWLLAVPLAASGLAIAAGQAVLAVGHAAGGWPAAHDDGRRPGRSALDRERRLARTGRYGRPAVWRRRRHRTPRAGARALGARRDRRSMRC